MDLYREKIDQATGILAELDLDAWLLFVRETAEMADPSFKLIAPAEVVWPSAFIIARNGARAAIVGRFDAEVFRRIGLYSEVVGYDQDIAPDLRRVISGINPRSIAINYSSSSHAADGISYGMYLALTEALAGTPYAGRLVTAERVVAKVRGRKSETEIRLIREAVALTEQLFADLTPSIRPGRTEKDLAAILSIYMDAEGVTPAWDAAGCPIVNAGANIGGHAGPTDAVIERGQVIHLDFGVRKAGYCSDLQRIWYLRKPGQRLAQRRVQYAFDAVRKTIEAGAAALKPGAVGWQVDDVGRRCIVAAGYPEFQHALGHQVGRAAHDGSTILGPRWERYGNTPMGAVEAGNVFTLELGVQVEEGFVGVEEDVLVTAHGCEFLSTPQTEIWYV